jgi:hypothetical protein
MYWVVQVDLFQVNERDKILAVLERFDIPHQAVTLTSEGQLHPEVTHTGRIITNGSVLLSRLAVARGWQPGSLLNDNFSYAVWHPHLREHLLNRAAVFTTVRDADPPFDEFFIRPLDDQKSFNGRMITLADFQKWRLAQRPDTMMLYAPARALGQEYRHFMVDGKAVSSSRYRMGSTVSLSAMVDAPIIAFAERMAALWSPARAFVLDTYVTGDEMGIVELGCICNAGFYEADVQKIVMALNEMD